MIILDDGWITISSFRGHFGRNARKCTSEITLFQLVLNTDGRNTKHEFWME